MVLLGRLVLECKIFLLLAILGGVLEREHFLFCRFSVALGRLEVFESIVLLRRCLFPDFLDLALCVKLVVL